MLANQELVGFQNHQLDQQHGLWVGRIPDHLRFGSDEFEQLWSLKPDFHHKVRLPFSSRMVEIKRWQQSWGADYAFSGNVLSAVGAIPDMLRPLVSWCRDSIDSRLNGVLANFYQGPDHYISQHHDSTDGLIEQTPIVTVSFGETRTFRMSHSDHKSIDFPSVDGGVFVMPADTHRAWKHGVPVRKSHTGRRVSITLRAFRNVQFPFSEMMEG